MSIIFGFLEKYHSDRGFGFVVEKGKPAERSFFHCSTIKEKYEYLAEELKKDDYTSVSKGFWYENKLTHKGLQVNEIWLTLEELPDSYLEQINAQILARQSLCKSIENRISELDIEYSRLDESIKEKEDKCKKARHDSIKLEAEILLLNQNIKKRESEIVELKSKISKLSAESSRLVTPSREVLIKQFCMTRDIHTLIHFTHISNLPSILSNGLISRGNLEQDMRGKFRFNDEYRYDKCRNAICLSISFPNYKMFYSYNNKAQHEWVVIELSSSILWELDCAFCHENAASTSVTTIPLEQRKSFSALEKMFDSQAYGVLPKNYTKSPQAEVLVFDKIPPQYIKNILFKFNKGTNIFCDDKYFKPRQDYESHQRVQESIITEVKDNPFLRGKPLLKDANIFNLDIDDDLPF